MMPATTIETSMSRDEPISPIRYFSLKAAVNFVLFYVAWLICVYTAGVDSPAVGIGVIAISLLIHFIITTDAALKDASIILICGALGGLVETIHGWLNVYEFVNKVHIPNGAIATNTALPTWIIFLWFLFGMTLRYSLKWFLFHLRFTPVAGALGGILSYFAAAELNAIQLHANSAYALAVIAVTWGVTFLLICGLINALFPDQQTT